MVYKLSSADLQGFIDGATAGIHSVDASGAIIYANRAEMDMLGYSEEEYLGRNIFEFHADKTAITNIFSLLQQNRTVVDHPATLLCKDGSTRDVLINSSAHFEDGQLAYSRCFTRDITEHTQAKKALLESEAEFQFMADAMPQQVWTACHDGTLDYVNKRVADNFGVTTEKVLGEGWITFIHPEDVDQCIKKWKHSLLTGELYEVEFRLHIEGEGYRWHLARAVPLIRDGKVVKWYGTNTDIDSHKQADQKKDEFISIASHELKTPLTNIKAFIQLAEKTVGSPKAPNFLKKAQHHVMNLQRLISDLLDTSKINAGKMSYNFEELDFADLVKESISNFSQQSPTHKIILESNADVKYHGDKFRIEQVLVNFLSNAVKYSPDADKITVKSAVQDANIVVSVQDYGIGIEPEHLTKLFDRFYRIDSTAMKYQGLGLGLYISSEIVKGHGGTFWIESEPQQGSTFYFSLPLKAALPEDVDTDDKTFYRTNFINIEYNQEHQRLEVDWLGFQNLESVQKGGLLMLEFLQKNQCEKVLNDNTNVKGNWSEASDWAGKVWFPMMQRAGLKHFAWIYSPSTFSALAAKKSVDVMIGDVQTQFFYDRGEAVEWLSDGESYLK